MKESTTTSRSTAASGEISTSQDKRKFLSSMSIYGLELAVAMATLFILLSVLSIDAYAFMGFLFDSKPDSTGGGYAALWTATSAIVWLPVFVIFYMRSRAHMARHPELSANTTQRTFVIIFQILAILMVISFAFAAVYSLLSALANASDTAEMIVRSSVPAAIAALVWAWGFVAFFKKPFVSRRTYVGVLSLVSILIVLGTIIMSIVALRYANEHTPTHSDYKNNYQYNDYRDNYYNRPRSY